MRIPSIRNFTPSVERVLLQSTWKERVVGILCVASLFYLIRCVVSRLKTSPKGSDSSSPSLKGRVDKKPPAPLIEPPKADLSYIKTAVKEPDFLKEYQSEFGTWLSEQMESYEGWLLLTEDLSRQAPYFLVLRRFIPELKVQVEKMIPIFKAHPNVKKDDWDAFFKECNAITDQKITSTDSCLRLKACLDKLQSWNAALHDSERTLLMQQLNDVKNHPHYEFTDLQTQYFHYLGLHTQKEFSHLLSAERPFLATVGLLEMEDIDLLQLRTMQPSIERLRQMFCFSTITGDEKGLRTLIEKEIDRCRDVLKGSYSLSDELRNGQELKEIIKLLRGLFDKLPRNFADGLAQLKEIEQKDIARQLIHLKGYIHQQGHLAKWKKLNEKDEIFRLIDYPRAPGANKISEFYQMGD